MGSCCSKPIKRLTMGEQLDCIQEQLQKQYEQSISTVVAGKAQHP